jgi:hypothetical protein
MARDVYAIRNIQTDSVAQSASYPMAKLAGVFFLEIKADVA